MPKICELLLNLQGFQYVTSLDLNMVYYHTRISKQVIYVLLYQHGTSISINT